MNALPAVLVDVAALTEQHVILVDGLPARIDVPVLSIDGSEVLLEWRRDSAPEGVERWGELRVPADGTVQAVRWADWLAARATELPANPWDLPSDC